MTATHARQAFVSFCGRVREDKAVARALLARLNAQPLEAWIYERPGSFAPPGGDVSGRLRQRICESDVFVPLVTRAGFDSRYVVEEIEYALERARVEESGPRALRIAPIAPQDIAQIAWPPPFASLQAYGPLYYAEGGEAAIEPTVRRVCEVLDQHYLPPDPFRSRLPLRRRLMLEIGDRVPRRPKYDAGIYDDLLYAALCCEVAEAEDDLGAAGECVDRLRGLLVDEFDDVPGYYPLIVRGVLEARDGRLESARQTFYEALDLGEPLVDESAYGAIGFTYISEGASTEALPWYERAAAVCPRHDPAIAFNLLLCHVASGTPIEEAAVVELLGEEGDARFLRMQEEHARIELLRAVAYLHMGRLEDAERVFTRECCQVDPPADLLVAFAQRLEGRFEPAVDGLVRCVTDVLERIATRNPGWALMHPLGRLAHGRGDHAQALRTFAWLCEAYPEVAQLHLEYALCLVAAGKRRAARKAARRALDCDGPTQDFESEDCDQSYYRGFARWMMGQSREAAGEFLESGRGDDEWYGSVCDSGVC